MSSAAPSADAEHAIPPLQLGSDPAAVWATAEATLLGWDRVERAASADGYLHVVCTTRWMRFHDDLELWLDADAGVIQVRSASRVGHSDMGVNRMRVEALRDALSAP